jgi:hypothetical protein
VRGCSSRPRSPVDGRQALDGWPTEPMPVARRFVPPGSRDATAVEKKKKKRWTGPADPLRTEEGRRVAALVVLGWMRARPCVLSSPIQFDPIRFDPPVTSEILGRDTIPPASYLVARVVVRSRIGQCSAKANALAGQDSPVCPRGRSVEGDQRVSTTCFAYARRA